MTIENAIAVTRFGLGAMPGEIEGIDDPKAWLLKQIDPACLAEWSFESSIPSKQLLSDLQMHSMEIRTNKTAARSDQSVEKRRVYLRSARQIMKRDVVNRAAFGATTTASFHERLVRFWSNHFSISARNIQTRLIAGAYEREAIRPYILGDFTTLARQAVLHPGMLIYLDNVQSIGPNSRGSRRGRRGLNENLAREVLELHTVTMAANYSQADVTEFARALTGWTVGNHRDGQDHRGEAVFAERIHEPGTRTILGKNYGQTDGAQAEAILRDLCMRPETAHNIAFKLARHFVSDTPPPSLVTRLAKVFLETDGNLGELYTVLIHAPEAWQREPQKVKTPDDLLTSTARLIGVKAVFAGKPKAVYVSLAQRPFYAPTPEGWPDEAGSWLGPDALMKRIEWANRVAERSPNLDARALLEQGLGELASTALSQAVRDAESGRQALALALMSPSFQRR